MASPLQSVPVIIFVFVMLPNANTFKISDRYTYQAIPKFMECSFWPTFISNVTCEMKRLNRTAHKFTKIVYLKPGVVLHKLFVSSQSVVSSQISEVLNKTCIFSRLSSPLLSRTITCATFQGTSLM